MKSEIYKKLKADLDNIQNQNYQKDLKNIIKDIANLESIYKGLIKDEDLKIIIANYGFIRKNELSYSISMEHEKKEIEENKETMDLYYRYFDNEEELEEYAKKDNYSFASVIEAQNTINKIMKTDAFYILFNIIGTFLIIFGFIYSIAIAVHLQSILFFITTFGNYLICSLFFFGLARIINILHDIRKKLYIK